MPRSANLPAIISQDSEISYRQWQAQSLSIGGAFEPAERVAVAMRPSVDALIVLNALLLAEAVPCMINPAWPPSQVQQALAACQATRIIRSLDDIHKPAAQRSCKSSIKLERPGLIVFTSGSSGNPKPAVLSPANFYYGAIAANHNIPLQPGDRWLMSLPLHHVSGLGLAARCTAARATIAVPQPGLPLLEALDLYKPTHLSLVPTQLYRILSDARGARALARLKAVLVGGAAVPPGLVRRALDAAVPIHNSYGLTETASQIAATQPRDGLDALMTSGTQLTPGTIKISAQGEILVRGKTLFLGYLIDGALARPTDADGWFATNDLGHFDQRGRLIVNGRRDNMFISGGENVQPEEVERALCSLPGVIAALVVPINDPEYGQVGCALVRTEHDTDPDAETLRDQLRDHLPGYKIPRKFLKMPPEVSTDKINRKAFRPPQ